MRKAGELTEEDEKFVRFVVMKIAAEVTRQALADASFALLGKAVDLDQFENGERGKGIGVAGGHGGESETDAGEQNKAGEAAATKLQEKIKQQHK